MSLSLLSATVTVAIICWWFAFMGHRPLSRRRMACAALGGAFLGGPAFALGSFGPLIFTPQYNLGPLLGIFITGPLGFAFGVLAGWIWSFFRREPLPARPA